MCSIILISYVLVRAQGQKDGRGKFVEKGRRRNEERKEGKGVGEGRVKSAGKGRQLLKVMHV